MSGTRALLACALVGAGVVRGARAEPEVDRLRAENARLSARVAELEAENARLRRESGAPLAAALEDAATAAVTAEVDPATGTTTVATPPSRLERSGGVTARHWLTLSASRPGSPGAARVREAHLVIATAASSGQYRAVKVLRLTADGVAIDCPVVDYRSEAITVARTPGKLGERETVTAAVAASDFPALAGARTIEGRLGPTTFRLTPEQLASLRAFLRRLDDQAP